jgi:hypothetical protein
MDEAVTDRILETLIRIENAILFLKMNPSYFPDQGEKTRNWPQEAYKRSPSPNLQYFSSEDGIER